MEFDYIAGYYLKNKDKEIVKAGFLKLADAQRYMENLDDTWLLNGFAYIDAPEGKYILGEKDYRNSGKRWYAPAEWEKALIYDVKKDECVGIDSFIDIYKYYDIQKYQKHCSLAMHNKCNFIVETLKNYQKEIDTQTNVNNLENQRTPRER